MHVKALAICGSGNTVLRSLPGLRERNFKGKWKSTENMKEMLPALGGILGRCLEMPGRRRGGPSEATVGGNEGRLASRNSAGPNGSIWEVRERSKGGRGGMFSQV